MDNGGGTWTVAGDSQSQGQVKNNKNKKTQKWRSLSMAVSDGGWVWVGLVAGNSAGEHGFDNSDKVNRLPYFVFLG
ncbi:hypothetical protein EUGRSUZ_I01677 [Eucalyptus grandis]|uniref:Uncharacterized protein n=2 Tax=Eucalyptus grandis TaxID=71139 RepID=A0ACC3JG13_EUCGR|nr:hypothetical protein EUGRSUZ_I01677 [Eucalyptus grandis]